MTWFLDDCEPEYGGHLPTVEHEDTLPWPLPPHPPAGMMLP